MSNDILVENRIRLRRETKRKKEKIEEKKKRNGEQGAARY